MALLLLCLLLADSAKSIEARFVEKPPVIDGLIEEIWQTADSACDFIQRKPDEGKPATQKTVAYVLTDRENLYIAFKCYDTELDKLVLRLKPRDEATGDMVAVLLDSFGDKCSAYRLDVNARGVMADYYLTQDGQNIDVTWDGIWYSATTINEWGYAVEIKIPFRTLRYSKDLKDWGINFSRYVDRRQEGSYWSPQKINEGIRVSRFGVIAGLRPEKAGRQIEFYPAGLIRYEETDEKDISADGGLDLFWPITPASRLQLTANPDFAQIEADPYQLNLTKYEYSLEERRPFFTEARELFSPPQTSVNIGSPIDIYYSRRIGKPLPDGQAVPIVGGVRFNGRFERFQTGIMGVICKKTSYEDGGEMLTEPQSYFTVARLKRDFFTNSEVGLLYSAKENKDYFNRALVFDGSLRLDEFSLSLQEAGTRVKNGTTGLGSKLDVGYLRRNFFAGCGYKIIEDDFDTGGVGLQGWKGLEYGMVTGFSAYNWDIIRSSSIGFFAGQSQEAGEPYMGDYYGGWLEPVFRNGLGINVNVQKNIDYEMDVVYEALNYSAGFWTESNKPVDLYGFFGWSTLSYNYQRGYFAPGGGIETGLNIRPLTNLGISIHMNDYVECDSLGRIIEDNIVWHIKTKYCITKDLHIRFYCQPNFITDIHDLNVLLSYNFRPKSWLYIGWNETRETNRLVFASRTGVIKVKYLFCF